jgi:hypothetical protein
VAIHGYVGLNHQRMLYACSDDGGKTWRRADGSSIPGLPLRGEDGEANQADVVFDGGGGISRVIADLNGTPALNTGHSYVGSYVWDGSAWRLRKDVPGHRPYARPDGSVIFTAAWATWVADDLDPGATIEEFKGGLHIISQYGVITTGKLYGIAVNGAGDHIRLIERREVP